MADSLTMAAPIRGATGQGYGRLSIYWGRMVDLPYGIKVIEL